MNIRLVRDLLIDAVKLDRETQDHIGPAPLRGQQLPFVHGFSDMAQWGKAPNDPNCQLDENDGDPFATITDDFWDQYDRDPSPAEISRADAVQRWFSYIDVDAERRALVAWLKSKVGGKDFKRWCRQVEGISTTTGTKRKNRALDKIFAELQRRPVQDSHFRDFGVLHPEPEISDVSATIPTGLDHNEGLNNWAASDAIPVFEAEVPQSAFSWAAKRNERRRRQRARKAAKKAKAKGNG